ncbi:MAG TPA: vanadium-dependent haloperoxidase, partial [Thermoanaerobaculia bacterium]|nr:vanadium-dependent haloperoxidase [Thermoanaerobaculia bacterium]
VPIGGSVRLVNPLAASSFTLSGVDPQCTEVAAPPLFSSAEQAAEALELYWMALLRDVPFAEWESDPLVARACTDLSRLSHYDAAREDGRITPKTLFRGATKGDRTGPYLSQFLWKEAPFGAIRLEQRVRTATAGLDYLTQRDEWLAVQNGAPAAIRHANAYRYIRTLRDLASYVQFDFSYQAFQTACLVLFGMQRTTDAQFPYKGAPYDSHNPYRGAKTQTGFITFGVAQALDLVARVSDDALKASWHHKWNVHRRLRPEEFGGRVHETLAGNAKHPIHEELLASDALARVRDAHGSWYLPQAYAEGAPLHPSYPAGHAAIAGACTTVLKAYFDESWAFDDPVVPTADGTALAPYSGERLTIGGELDKLATNIAFGRDAAGVHWRSDGLAGLLLGEAVAMSVLADVRLCCAEEFGGFSFTKFDGTVVTV